MCYESRKKLFRRRKGTSNKGRGNEGGHKQEQDAIIYTFTNISQRNSSLHILTRKKKKSYIKKDPV